jgi:hypothetical protein
MEVDTIVKIKETKITEKIPFKVVIPIKEYETENESGSPLRFTGLARTTEVSLNRNRTTEKCIKKIKSQINEAVAANKPYPSFIDHEGRNVCGNIVGVKESTDAELWPITELLRLSGNPVVDAPMQQVLNWHENNVAMGQSISGLMTEATFMENEKTGEWWFEIDDMDFHESSVTNEPAIRSTRNTIQFESCKHGFCNQIVEQIIPKIREKYPMVTKTIDKVEEELPEEVKEDLEESNMAMDEETKEAIEKLTETQNTLTKGMNMLVERENARIAKEKAAEEAQARADLKEELKEELIKELLPEITETVVDAGNTVISEKLEFITKGKDRLHERKSDKVVEDKTKVEGEIVPLEDKKERKWSLTDSVNYPPVLNGKIVETGYTSSEIVDIIMG